ncbi:MAG: FAD:protein FMN transferase [Treponema sp.]|nr:FAD:protein FMN transferase [Treponema sp.]
MNKTKITVPFICAVIALSGCSGRGGAPDTSSFTARTRHTTVAFGTVSVLRLYDDFTQSVNAARFERVWNQTREILTELDGVFSTSNPDSDVARFNALAYGESIAVSAHMARVIAVARKAHGELGGLFDPTVFPFVDLWGFSPRFRVNRFAPIFPYDRPQGRNQLPGPEYIEAFTRLVGFCGVVLEGCEASGFTLTKMIPPVVVNGVTYQAKLDFGAIVKGYAADLVLEVMLREGFRFGYFSSGGSSIALLSGMDYIPADDGLFQFALRLRKPRPGRYRGSAFISIMTSNTSLSTSGDYDHAFFVDGIRYSHIFDPRSGRPVNAPLNGRQSGIASATVFGENGAFAEGLSTGLLVMTLTEAIEFMNRLENHSVVLVYYKAGHDFFEIITNIPARLITVLDPAYILASRLNDQGDVEYTGILYRSAGGVSFGTAY